MYSDRMIKILNSAKLLINFQKKKAVLNENHYIILGKDFNKKAFAYSQYISFKSYLGYLFSSIVY